MVIINLIIKLLKSKDLINKTNYNNIFIIIDRLTKYKRFTPINKSYITKDLTNIIIREIVNNYELPNEFINDKKTIFTFKFFTILII